MERKYAITRLRPSDLEWLADNINDESVRETLLEKIEIFLNNGRDSIAHLDTVWCCGIELNSILGKDDWEDALKNVKTKRKEIFMQGITGYPFSP